MEAVIQSDKILVTVDENCGLVRRAPERRSSFVPACRHHVEARRMLVDRARREERAEQVARAGSAGEPEAADHRAPGKPMCVVPGIVPRAELAATAALAGQC